MACQRISKHNLKRNIPSRGGVGCFLHPISGCGVETQLQEEYENVRTDCTCKSITFESEHNVYREVSMEGTATHVRWCASLTYVNLDAKGPPAAVQYYAVEYTWFVLLCMRYAICDIGVSHASRLEFQDLLSTVVRPISRLGVLDSFVESVVVVCFHNYTSGQLELRLNA